MEQSNQVRLHGFWASPFVFRVIWALKLKGVEYEYVEEDLSSKSAALLEYNPVHKKVPVLVHNGKPVAESVVILQYIEETWPDQTPLLPEDPYERAMARFWINFGEQKERMFLSIQTAYPHLQHNFLDFHIVHKLYYPERGGRVGGVGALVTESSQGPTFFALFKCSEDDKQKTATEVVETLKTIEEKALGDKRFFGGKTISLVDLCFGWLAYSLEYTEQVVGVQVLQPTTLPRLHRWTLDFKQEPVIKENLPDGIALSEHFQKLRKRLTSPNNRFNP